MSLGILFGIVSRFLLSELVKVYGKKFDRSGCCQRTTKIEKLFWLSKQTWVRDIKKLRRFILSYLKAKNRTTIINCQNPSRVVGDLTIGVESYTLQEIVSEVRGLRLCALGLVCKQTSRWGLADEQISLSCITNNSTRRSFVLLTC